MNELVPGARGRDTLRGLSKSMALGAIDKVVEEEKWKTLIWSVNSHNCLMECDDVNSTLEVRCRSLHSPYKYKKDVLVLGSLRVRLSYAPDWLTSAMKEAFGAYQIVYRIGQKPVRGLALPLSPVLQWFIEIWPHRDDRMYRIKKYFALCSETYCKYHMGVGQRFEWSRGDHPLPPGDWEVVRALAVGNSYVVRPVVDGVICNSDDEDCDFSLPSYGKYRNFLKLI